MRDCFGFWKFSIYKILPFAKKRKKKRDHNLDPLPLGHLFDLTFLYALKFVKNTVDDVIFSILDFVYKYGILYPTNLNICRLKLKVKTPILEKRE